MNNKLILRIQKEFLSCDDFIIKEISLSKSSVLYVLYLESVSSSSLVHEFILNNLSLHNIYIYAKLVDITLNIDELRVYTVRY